MKQDHFQECEDAVQRDLDELSLMLDFISASFKVYSRSGAILSNVAQDGDLRQLMIDFRDAKINDLTVLYQALYVQVWAAFEGFVRKLLVAYLEAFIDRKSDFDTLEKYGLGRRNLEYTGRVLQHIRQDRPRYTLDFFALARNMSTSIPGSSHVKLNSAVFPLLISGPSADGLKDALDRIGFDLRWDDLGRIEELQASVRSKGTRETAKQIELFLGDVARRRHSIVHKSDTSEVVSAADLSDTIHIFRTLAKSLLKILRMDCEKKTA
jgi:RiboL-PSP-HEPN